MGRTGVKKREKKVRVRSKSSAPVSTPSVQKGGSDRRWYVLFAVVVAIVLMSYSNSLTNQFVFDDLPLIVENHTIQGVEKIPRLLGIEAQRSSYRPVRMVTYAVDYTLNKVLWGQVVRYEGDDEGLNPLGYHIANCVYHVVTSGAVLLVVAKLVGSYRVAFFSAALFALHPVHTDSVTYISGRRDILCALFYLLGFYWFLCYRQTGRMRFIIAACAAYVAGLGSKEMAVTLPLMFFCYELIEGFSGGGTRAITYAKEFFATVKRIMVRSRYLYGVMLIGALFFIYYKVFIKSPSFRSVYYGESAVTTFLTMGKIVVYYMRLLVLPVTLNADYSYNAFPLSTSFFEPATFLSFIMLGVVGYGVVRWWSTYKMEVFGVVWFFVTLLPVCQIIPHHELLAEHYLYLPSFGICVVVGSVIDRWVRGGRYNRVVYGCGVAVVVLCSLRIIDRNYDWRDGFTLWEKTVKTVPQCGRAHNNLGLEYDKKGWLERAKAQYETALSIDPTFANAHNNLGLIYYQNGDLEKAIAKYKRALELKPRYAAAHVNLGAAYDKKGEINEAFREFFRARSINPKLVEAYIGLGVCMTKMGAINYLDVAIGQFKKALEIKPNLAEAHSNLAIVYYLKGDFNSALLHCKKLEELGYKVPEQLREGLKSYR